MYLSEIEFRDRPLARDHPCRGCPVRDVAVCSSLSQAELQEFRRSGSTRLLAPEEALCWEGGPATRVYSVTHGMLRLSKLLVDGRRQIIGFAFPGDFVGITTEDEHPFTAEAVTRSELCAFPRTRFEAFVAAHPRFEHGLYAAAARELAAAREQLLLLGRKSASERLASFLLHMADRTPQDGVEGGVLVRLPMSRTDIADYLGLRIETVSRELTALKSARRIRMMNVHELLIADRRVLELASVGDPSAI